MMFHLLAPFHVVVLCLLQSKQTKPTNHEDHSLSVDMENSVGQQEADFQAEKKILINGNPQSNTEPVISPADANVTDTAMNVIKFLKTQFLAHFS